MARRLRHHIHEGDGMLILVNPVRGDFAAEDLGEDVVVVISGRAGHHESPRFSQRRASFKRAKDAVAL
ncbi:hypothetical protein ACOJBO_35600 [Rhizobium beringeri]